MRPLTITSSLFAIFYFFMPAVLSPAAEGKLSNAEIEGLIDQMVLGPGDTYLMDGRTYLAPAGTTRINQAAERLGAEGRTVWPQLFAHLDDKRESTPSFEIAGPHTIGHKCYLLIKNQIMDFPRGYPYSKMLAEGRMGFKPTLQEWLTKRKDVPLDVIRKEVLESLITMETDAKEHQAVDLLQSHLETINERIDNAAGGEVARQKRQTLLVGPFSLGDFYSQERCHETLVKHYGREVAPSEESVVKELNRCEFMVRDKSVRRENGTWGFAKGTGKSLPTVLVSGDLTASVTNSKGQVFTFYLAKAELLDTHTEVFDNSSESWRRVRFTMHWQVRFPDTRDRTDYWGVAGQQFSVAYDTQGKRIAPPATKN